MRIFSETEDKEWDAFDLHFLLDRKHVIKYGICGNRHSYTGGVGLAIGPHYFAPSDFWSYENSQRFKMAATTDAVEHNLRLLDEFLGYPVPKPPLG